MRTKLGFIGSPEKRSEKRIKANEDHKEMKL
jgi:hypothetical protein